MSLPIRWYSYEELRRIAADFLCRHNPVGSIPVPIDTIIEFGFGIDIIPLPGFLQVHEVDAFLSRDCTSIAIDEGVFNQRSPNRYRFSLAHELAHVVLHEDIYAQFQFSNVEEWKEEIAAIPDTDYNRLEWQANNFAGLVLVPDNHLKEKFQDGLRFAAEKGFALDAVPDVATDYLCKWTSGFFNVSPGVIEVRLDRDKLWPPTTF